MNGKRKKNMLLYLVAGTLFIFLGSTSAKNTYYMDSSLDCGYIGLQDVGRDQTVMVHAKTTDTSSSSQLGCTINFQAVDNDATIRIDFESFIVNNCDVKLYISGDSSGSMSSYSCGDDPSMYSSIGRSVTLTLHRTKVTATEYNFRLKLIAVRAANAEPTPCCVSKRFFAHVKTLAAKRSTDGSFKITENEYEIDYDHDMRTEARTGTFLTVEGGHKSLYSYTLINDYGTMKSYYLFNNTGTCSVDKITYDETAVCVPSFLHYTNSYMIGAGRQFVQVNTWEGVDGNFTRSMQTSAYDCTPVSASYYGTSPEGDSIVGTTLYGNYTQYQIRSSDVFNIPASCVKIEQAAFG